MSRDTKILIGIGVIIALIIAWFAVKDFMVSQNAWVCEGGQWTKKGNPTESMPLTGCGVSTINDFASCVAGGNEIIESSPRSCKTSGGQVFIENIEQNVSDLINVANPKPNQAVSSPLNVTGQARGPWYFEASFPIILEDGTGKVLAQTAAQAQGEWTTQEFVPFTAVLNFSNPATATGTLILQKDNPSGLAQNAQELRVPVQFQTASSTSKTTVNVYFNNENLDPEFTCNRVFPVQRQIPATTTVAKAALEELLKGPSSSELNEKYYTNINPGVKINSLVINNSGTARVDFSDQLEYQVGGSCRVSAIRSQITQTLKQFPTVKNVVISINGRTEDILQP